MKETKSEKNWREILDEDETTEEMPNTVLGWPSTMTTTGNNNIAIGSSALLTTK